MVMGEWLGSVELFFYFVFSSKKLNSYTKNCVSIWSVFIFVLCFFCLFDGLCITHI